MSSLPISARFIIRDSRGAVIYHNLTRHSKVDGFGWEPGAGFILWEDIAREGWTVETAETHPLPISIPSDLASAAPGLYRVFCIAGATVMCDPIQPGDSLRALDYLPSAMALSLAYGVSDEFVDVEIVRIDEHGDCHLIDCETVDMERMPT